jgi:hypothetical protein
MKKPDKNYNQLSKKNSHLNHPHQKKPQQKNQERKEKKNIKKL